MHSESFIAYKTWSIIKTATENVGQISQIQKTEWKFNQQLVNELSSTGEEATSYNLDIGYKMSNTKNVLRARSIILIRILISCWIGWQR